MPEYRYKTPLEEAAMSTEFDEDDPRQFATEICCQFCGKTLQWNDDDGDCVEWVAEGTDFNDKPACEKCARDAEWNEWLESTLDQIAALADEHEWDFSRSDYEGGFNTKSRYYTLYRECDNCVLGQDGCSCETLKLRVSDHGSAHCTEEISLAMNAGGDDHTIEALKARLSR